MADYILFMHGDAGHRDTGYGRALPEADWSAYLSQLRVTGAFQGGSAIGDGVCVSKSPPPAAITKHITGYIQVRAESLEAARELLVGNPVYEAGGTVEIRELPETG